MEVFAREHGLSAHRMSWWRWRLEEEGGKEPKHGNGRLVPMVVSAGPSESHDERGAQVAVSIETRAGLTIFVSKPSAVEPQWLARVISELEQT
jgi:hypothetical protein